MKYTIFDGKRRQENLQVVVNNEIAWKYGKSSIQIIYFEVLEH